MVETALLEYVRKLKRQGYSESTIRSELLKAGYSPNEIARALALVERKRIELPAKAAVIIISIFLLAFILTFLGLKIFYQPIMVEVRTSPVTKELLPGQTLVFTQELENPAGRKTQVSLRHEIFSPTNVIIQSAEEKEQVEQRKVSQTQMQIPAQLQPGTYTLQTTAHWNEKTVSTNFTFIIREKEITKETVLAPEPRLPCPGDCNDFNSCTKDQCIKGKCVHEEIIPCCGNRRCEPGETQSCPEDCAEVTYSAEQIINFAARVAEKDSEKGAMLCHSVADTALADKCFAQIAQITGQTALCEQISATSTKDTCYMNFALEGNFKICDAVTNRYLRNSCFSLSRLA